MGTLAPEETPMMGRHQVAAKLYYNLSIDGLVRKNHLLRQILNVIDFSFIYELARPGLDFRL